MIEKFNEPDLALLPVLELIQTFKTIKKYYESLDYNDKRKPIYRRLLNVLRCTIDYEINFYVEQLNIFKDEQGNETC